MFTSAIVKTPGKSFVRGLTRANLGQPDYESAMRQHQAYIAALTACGLSVTVLDADESFPDSTFVEDTALLIPDCAIVTNPGAESRQGETIEIEYVLRQHFSTVESVQQPGTVDAGDIMMVDSHFYIGLSQRTNLAGAEQVIEILSRYGMTASTVPIRHALHLKSEVAYLENNNLIATGEFVNRPEFAEFNVLEIDPAESYAANCLWINGRVLVAAGFPQAKKTIESAGYQTIELDASEFQKLDGGLSCLSLRW